MNSSAMFDDDINDDAEDACLAKLGDILTQWPPGGRRRNDGPAEILEHVYLGSMVDALDLDLLRRLRITHVLNCAPSAVRRYADSLRVAADDCPSSWRTSSCCERAAGRFSLIRIVKAVRGNPSQSYRVRSVTCHRKSQSATCHLTQVNASHLNPNQTGRYSIPYLPRRRLC